MKYLWLIIKHKWFVLLAGFKTKAPLWRLIMHDWTKFLPCELPHYQRQFFGKADNPEGFIKCWIHHQNHNPHHWEYWIPRTGHNRCNPPYPDNSPVEMPEWAVREMIADWMGASRAYEGKWPTEYNWHWFRKNFPKILTNLHPKTRYLIEEILIEMDFLDIILDK